jgi:hypothetical protein
MKRKLKSIAKLTDDCAVLLQKLVRVKAADHDGMCACVTCGKIDHWKAMQGGHFIERGRLATKLMEENIHPQCPGCNLYRMKTATGVLDYRRWMVDFYGDDWVGALELLSRETRKYTRSELEELKTEYRAMIKALE